MLLGILDGPTQDVDLVAILEEGKVVSVSPIPLPIAKAASEVSQDLGLPRGWFNPGPTSLLDLGLPEGFLPRCIRSDFGGLVVHVVGR